MRKLALCMLIAPALMQSFATSAQEVAVTTNRASSDLSRFFNNLGFAANVTGSHSYDSQAAGFASLGSVYARSQSRNLQLVHADAPGFRSGCAGIDLYAGGVSYIKGDQIVQFMQSILSSSGGYALNLALETEVPEIAHAMQFSQKLASEVNNMNFNSCEMGEATAAALWPRNRKAHQQLCEDLGKNSGTFTDWAMARQQCSTGGQIETQLNQAKNNPEYADRVLVDTNVVWDGFEKNDFFKGDNSKDLKEVYMSISGTIVFDKKGALQSYPSLANNPEFIKAMLYGGQLPSYKCEDGDKIKCLNPSLNGSHTIAVTDALVNKVQVILNRIYNHIKEGSALDPEDHGLIELTQPPVFNLISSSAAQNIGIQSSYELAQTVATDLLAQYLSSSLDTIRTSLLSKDIGSINEEKLFKSIQSAQQFVDNFNADSRARFNAALTTNQLVQENVRQAFNGLNPMLKSAYNGESI